MSETFRRSYCTAHLASDSRRRQSPASLKASRRQDTAGGFTWIWFARLAGPRSVSKSPAVRPPPRPSLQVFGDAALQPDHLGPAVVFVGCRVALHVLEERERGGEEGGL